MVMIINQIELFISQKSLSVLHLQPILNEILNHDSKLLKSKSGSRRISFGKFLNFTKVCIMNFLAHAQLSFHQPEILVGNMISDFVKGKKQYDFSPGIQQGIKLHRAIDQFTDTHPVTKELKQYFRLSYGLYAGVFTDVMYDYFLANEKT